MTWYVDYNKLSHKKTAVISYIINKIKKNYGDLSVVRGNKHNLLRRNIEMKDNKIQIDMVKQL